jgi:hypothetical protein
MENEWTFEYMTVADAGHALSASIALAAVRMEIRRNMRLLGLLLSWGD